LAPVAQLISKETQVHSLPSAALAADMVEMQSKPAETAARAVVVVAGTTRRRMAETGLLERVTQAVALMDSMQEISVPVVVEVQDKLDKTCNPIRSRAMVAMVCKAASPDPQSITEAVVVVRPVTPALAAQVDKAAAGPE
jgi:hypothetical protein